ncbi:MAG TPA: MFS transporter [Gryllotalpicola sp.]
MTAEPVSVARGRTLPRGVAFVAAAVGFAALYLAAGAPTPLFVVFQQQWGFPEWELTVAFASYAIGLLAALLVVGSLSDHLGRRPVLIVSLLVELAAMLMFVFAPGIGWVIAARTVQGIATGAATSAFTAFISEAAPERLRRLGGVVSAIAPAGGLGLGALFAGVAVQFSARPAVIVFIALAVLMVASAGVTAFSRETIAPRAGAVASLVPTVSIPVRARAEFAAAVPVHGAAWLLAGLFLGLAPTIIREVFRIDSGAIEGLTVFIEPAAAAVAGLFLGRLGARRTTLVGGVGVLLGSVVIAVGILTVSLPVLWIGAAIGGVGFGASFSGALRLAAPLAEAHERAGLFAGIYVVAYLAFGVPALIAGQLVGPLGLMPTVVGYVVATVVVAAIGVAAQSRRAGSSARAGAASRVAG